CASDRGRERGRRDRKGCSRASASVLNVEECSVLVLTENFRLRTFLNRDDASVRINHASVNVHTDQVLIVSEVTRGKGEERSRSSVVKHEGGCSCSVRLVNANQARTVRYASIAARSDQDASCIDDRTGL